MSWGMVAVAGASLAGGAMAADAAGDAADSQAASADRANALSAGQFDQMRRDLSGYRAQGDDATNMLAAMLGVRGQFDGMTGEEIRAALLPRFRVSDPNNSNGVDDAGLNAAVDAEMAARRMSEGLGAQGQGYLLRNFTGDDLENEPGYQFGLAEGNKALDRRFASGGNYFSGAALKGATRYAQDYAGTKFGEGFNRDSANKTRVYNFLTGQQSIGQNAAAQTGNAGMTMASQVGANTTAMGNAQGASQIAQGNAWAGGLNNIAGMYQQNQLMDKITGGNSGWGGGEAWRTTGSGMPW